MFCEGKCVGSFLFYEVSLNGLRTLVGVRRTFSVSLSGSRLRSCLNLPTMDGKRTESVFPFEIYTHKLCKSENKLYERKDTGLNRTQASLRRTSGPLKEGTIL